MQIAYKNIFTLWQPRGVMGGWGGGGREVQEYIYGRFTLLYDRNQHNIVKQLSNLKKEHVYYNKNWVQPNAY